MPATTSLFSLLLGDGLLLVLLVLLILLLCLVSDVTSPATFLAFLTNTQQLPQDEESQGMRCMSVSENTRFNRGHHASTES